MKPARVTVTITLPLRSGRVVSARRYAEAVHQRSHADDCRHGHLGCALWPGGPCMDELLAAQEALDRAARARTQEGS